MALEPIDPRTAIELYLAERESELATSSLKSHRYRLGHFIDWCDQQGIENMNALTGRKIHEYRIWRRNDGDLSPASEKTQMDTIRVFIRFTESIDGVEQDLSTKVLSPTLSKEDKSRDVMLSSEQAQVILEHLEKYRYASLEHVLMTLLWRGMLRMGAARSLDVEDYEPEEQYLSVVHRPDTETPVKNQKDGERYIALSDSVCELLDDWLADRRPATEDEYSRRPLLATREGRIAQSTLRFNIYQLTQPCRYAECPHDRDPEECEYTARNESSKCPSSVSPHALRRGSITNALNSDVPDKVVSDRANVSPSVIDQHYDRRTEREKMEQRRRYLDDF